MEAKLLHSLVTKPPVPTTLTLTKHSTTLNYPIFWPSRRKQLKFSPIKSSSNADESSVPDTNSLPRPQITPPPESVEVRFRRRSKRRSRQRRDDDSSDRRFAKAAEQSPVQKTKKWEDMSAAEKVMELYMGEKGMLFWLNKFAYASIFIVIGGWILFRFVGPSLNLYQLDTPPLSPDSILKGSS